MSTKLDQKGKVSNYHNIRNNVGIRNNIGNVGNYNNYRDKNDNKQHKQENKNNIDNKDKDKEGQGNCLIF